jgi:hypothetical protein
MTEAVDTLPAGTDAIEAELTYSIDTGVKPVTASSGDAGHLRLREGTFDPRRVTVLDGRSLAAGFSLDREGFEFVRHETGMRDFHDPEELKTVYYPEIEALIRARTGASRVLIFDHTLRTGDEDEQKARKLREPVKVVHNDYTEWSGPQRVRDLLPPEEAERLLEHRLQVIQVWRPIKGPVLANPLAICDARTLSMDDLIPAERHHKDRIGEIYHIKHNPAHRWYYFPRMTRDEALVFKCYDSRTDVARFTAHGSFEDPATLADAPPRESIEMRALVFHAPDA